MGKLSDRNNTLQIVPTPQSPAMAGMIKQWGGTSNNITSGWLECDGSAISRTDFDQLFGAIGTKYGIGDGSTTFNLPNGPRIAVQVDLGDLAGWAGTTEYNKGLAYQDNSGQWFVLLHWRGTRTPDVGPYTTNYADRGLVWDQTFLSMAGQLNPAGGYAACQNVDEILMGQATSSSNWSFNATLPLASKPTDAFVSADSRFSTFDEALESIPIIKLYNDESNVSMSDLLASPTQAGKIALSAAYGATNIQYGFIKRYEETSFSLVGGTSDFTTGILKCVRVADVVSLTTDNLLFHSLNDQPEAGDIVIPEEYRPENNPIYGIYFMGSNLWCRVQISTDGTFRLVYYNSSTTTARSDSVAKVHVSYVVQ